MPIVDDEENLPVSSPAAAAPEPAPPTASTSDAARSEPGSAEDAIVAQVPTLKRYALALTRSADLAEELVQDCVTRALSRRHLFRTGASIRPWLFTIMHNLHVNRRRQTFARSALMATHGAPSEDIAPNQEQTAELAKVVRALNALPKEQQHVMLLVVVHELSYRETAAALRIPIGTVMSRLARGRERMREMLQIDARMLQQEADGKT
jgi:RNA polymerase sigma-70 factor (ECF subfamily)